MCLDPGERQLLGRLGGADDGRVHLLCDRVGWLHLDIDESDRLKPGSELRHRECAGDAADVGTALGALCLA